jgi:hypothetical protein
MFVARKDNVQQFLMSNCLLEVIVDGPLQGNIFRTVAI